MITILNEHSLKLLFHFVTTQAAITPKAIKKIAHDDSCLGALTERKLIEAKPSIEGRANFVYVATDAGYELATVIVNAARKHLTASK